MKALVTGASGFVGSALCRALTEAGHHAVGLTRDPERARARVPAEVELVRGGVGLPKDVAAAAKGCEVIFHAAGLAPGAAPQRVLRWLHVAGTENVVRAARHSGARRVVHMSCAEVSLHAGDRMHWDEVRVLPHAPLGAHAQSKLMSEELALAQSDHRLQVTALRPALLWGEGAFDSLASLVREGRERGLQLYGGGRNIVATTHIGNLARAALLAADAEAAPSRAYYVTDAEFLEAREFFGKLSQALGLPAPRLDGNLGLALVLARVKESLGGDAGAARARLLVRAKSALFDLSRATKDLGYAARLDLNQAMEELARWVREAGGAEGLLRQARGPVSERDVDEQVQAAGGD
ncbi:MAG: NAD-dependent epimerase/dehydratase family protein [Myxococcales bacterium]